MSNQDTDDIVGDELPNSGDSESEKEAEHVSDVEVTECFIVQYSVFAFICLSFVQRKEYI